MGPFIRRFRASWTILEGKIRFGKMWWQQSIGNRLPEARGTPRVMPEPVGAVGGRSGPPETRKSLQYRTLVFCRILQLDHILCTRTASRTNFGVKKQFLEAVASVIDRKTIARGQEDPCRHSGAGGGSRGTFGAA